MLPQTIAFCRATGPEWLSVPLRGSGSVAAHHDRPFRFRSAAGSRENNPGVSRRKAGRYPRDGPQVVGERTDVVDGLDQRPWPRLVASGQPNASGRTTRRRSRSRAKQFHELSRRHELDGTVAAYSAQPTVAGDEVLGLPVARSSDHVVIV